MLVSKSFNKAHYQDNSFVKSYGPKSPFWKYYLRSFFDLIGIKQPVEYYRVSKRIEFEYNTLVLWKKNDLNAPSILKREQGRLYLEAIQGKTLDRIFEGDFDFKIFNEIFEDLNKRHQLAFDHKESRFCHVDANLKNIIYNNNKIYHLDFEMGREYESIDLWARREISKLLISICNKLPIHKNQVLDSFFSIYKYDFIVHDLIESKLKNKGRDYKDGSLYELVLDLNSRYHED